MGSLPAADRTLTTRKWLPYMGFSTFALTGRGSWST